MYFLGRWVPMDVMNAIFVLWLVAAVTVAVLMFFLHRRGRSKKGKAMPPGYFPRGKRRRRQAR
jgi:hypothetical protein